MRTMHLFAGAGGGLFADLILGHEPVVAIDNDPYCCQVLSELAEEGWFSGLEVICDDIRNVDFSAWKGCVDQIAAGFPCQNISTAGKGEGIYGKQSGLWQEIIRAVDVIRPGLVFLENSPCIRTRGRSVLIREFVERGYSWRDGTLAASDVGAPHKRTRWWFLATDVDNLWELQQKMGIEAQWGWAEDKIKIAADTAGEGLEKCVRKGILSEVDYKTITSVEQYVGARGWNEIDLGICRVVHGMANRGHRIKALGNGQVPLCAAAAWLILAGQIDHIGDVTNMVERGG